MTEEIRYLTETEWKNLEKLVKPLRDKVIINLLYTTGCTVNELVNVKLSDFNLTKHTLKIHAKNSRNHEPRISFLSSSMTQTIQKFLDEEHPKNTEFILATRQSPQMTTKRVRQIVQGYTAKAGIKDKNNPQILRYTHIVHAFRKGVPIPSIQKQVGIKRSRAIQIFNELNTEFDDSAYRAFLD